MNWRKNVLAFIFAPLGTPISLAIWNGIALGPTSFRGIIGALPGYVIAATPVAYLAALLLGLPAFLLLSRFGGLTMVKVTLLGTIIGIITSLSVQIYISSYDFGQIVDYFFVDLMPIYVPSAIAGTVSAGLFWLIRGLKFGRK